MVVAVNRHGIIGRNNKLLWDIPEDMKHFQRLTLHTIVVMGRKTYESLPTGPLKSRINIVITSNPKKYTSRDSTTVIFCNLDDCEQIIKKIQKNSNKKVFIIGGSSVYEYFFNKCDRVYVTHVENEETSGVSIYPLLKELESNYEVINRIHPIENQNVKNNINYEIVTYIKK